MFFGFFLIIQSKLIQFVDELIGLFDVDILKFGLVASGGYLIIVAELKELVLQFCVRVDLRCEKMVKFF